MSTPKLPRLRAGSSALLSPVVAVVVAVAAASAVLLVSGFGAASLPSALAQAFTTNLPTTLRWTTPLLLTGGATALAFRARVWNIGLDGQLYVGAAAATATATCAATALPPNLALLVILVASFLGGAAFAAIPALLRIVAGAPEIVTTVILITVGRQLATYAVQGPLRSTNVALASSGTTDTIPSAIWLTPILRPSQASVGLFMALAGLAAVALYLRRTTWGYEHRIYGQNPTFSLYGGVSNRLVFLRAMLISGGLAGLAGGIEVLGVFHALQVGLNPGFGFDGVAVALAAGNNPLGIVVTALFFGALRSAGSYLQLDTAAPSQFINIVTAVVILLMTGRVVDRTGTSIRRWFGRRRRVSAVVREDDASG